MTDPQSPITPRVGDAVIVWPGGVRMTVTAVLPDGSLHGRSVYRSTYVPNEREREAARRATSAGEPA